MQDRSSVDAVLEDRMPSMDVQSNDVVQESAVLDGSDGAADISARDAESDAGNPVETGPGTGPYRVVTTDFVELEFRGGMTGGMPQTITCPEGTIGFGLDGTVATVGYDLDAPDLIRIVCTRLQPDGTLTNVLRSDSAGFWNSMAPPFQNYCNDGEVVVGLHGKISLTPGGTVFVSGLGVTCAPLVDWVAGRTAVRKVDATNSAANPVALFDDRCPNGYVFARLTMRWGAVTDGIRASCVRVTR